MYALARLSFFAGGGSAWRRRAGRRNERDRRPLAPLAPHQPRPAGDTATALEHWSV